jgi:hypothetical protein
MTLPLSVNGVRRARILAALVGALSTLAVAAHSAEAYTTLSLKTRRQIVHHADLPAPNHKGMIRRASCIEGRLSTVDGRWAMFFLTNTNACVRRYGGAAGGAGLLERTSTTSVDWEEVGEIGDNCSQGEGGATDAVLHDLGCGIIDPESRREPRASRLLVLARPTITPHGVGRLGLGRRAGALQRRRLIGNLRKGCEIDVGQRVAPLRAPLRGWAIFADGGNRLTSVSIEGGAETALGIGVGSTAAEARGAYPAADWDHMPPLGVDVLWVNDIDHPRFSILVDPETNQVKSISIPNPNFCE